MVRPAILVPIGGTVFTLAWLVLGAISPGYELFGHTIAPYSWVSQPVSGLGLGVTGPWMNAAFIGCGAVVLLGVLGTARHWHGGFERTAWILLCLMGVGMVMCGVFTLESMMLHLTGFLLAVPLPAIGLILAGVALRRHRRLAVAAVAGGSLALILFAVFMATFDATGAGGNTGVAGLVQRALILVAMASVSIVAVGVGRRADAGAPSRTAPEVTAVR